MSLNELFPEGRIETNPRKDKNWLTLPYQDRYLTLPKNTLTDRELALINLLTDQEDYLSLDPWQEFFKNQGKLPERLNQFQWLHVNHQEDLPDELRQLFQDLLPHLITQVSLSPHQSVMVLSEGIDAESLTTLEELLPTMESDFGFKLSLFVGNRWANLSEQEIRNSYKEEDFLFKEWMKQHGNSPLVLFSPTMFWGLSEQLQLPTIQQVLLERLNMKDNHDMILAMWKEQGNQVKTSQRLFIHRNSLQYRLDKLTRQTGLNLKNLDDLALSYLLLLKEN